MNGAISLDHADRDFFLGDGAAGVVREDPDRGREGGVEVLLQKRVQALMQRLAVEDTREAEDRLGAVVGVAEDDERRVDWVFHRGSCGAEDIVEGAVRAGNE